MSPSVYGTLGGGRGAIKPISTNTILLAGNNVTRFTADYKYERTFGIGIGVIDLLFTRLVSDVEAPDAGDAVEVWRTKNEVTTKIFDGFATQIKPEGAFFKVRAEDKLVQTKWREVTYSYDKDIDASAGEISEIFKDLVTTHAGLNADATSIQASGTVFVLDRFICNHESIFEKLTELAETLNWQFYYRADTDLVYFEPKGFTNNGVSFTVGTPTLSGKVPKWKKDMTQLKNSIILIGAESAVGNTQEFNGDGSTAIFTLAFVPISVKVFVDGVLQIGGITDSTSTFDYSVDKQNKQIIFESGSIPGAGANNVDVEYFYNEHIPVSDIRATSIDKFQLHEHTEILLDVMTVEDAENRVQELLDLFSEPFLTTKFPVNLNATAAVDTGHLVKVKDDVNAIDDFFVVQKIVYAYPSLLDVLTVGDEELRLGDFLVDVSAKVAKLNEEAARNQDILSHIRRVGRNQRPRRKQLTILKQDIGDGSILNHPVNGVLNAGKTLNGGGNAYTEEYDVVYF